MNVLIKLNEPLGNGLGPNFYLTSNIGVVTPFLVTKSQLLSGILVTVTDGATKIKIASEGQCTNFIEINIAGATTTTTTNGGGGGGTTTTTTSGGGGGGTTTTTTSGQTTTTTTSGGGTTTTTTNGQVTTTTTQSGTTTTTTSSLTTTTSSSSTTSTTTIPFCEEICINVINPDEISASFTITTCLGINLPMLINGNSSMNVCCASINTGLTNLITIPIGDCSECIITTTTTTLAPTTTTTTTIPSEPLIINNNGNSGAIIGSVGPTSWYLITENSLPLISGDQATGVHVGYSGNISVNITVDSQPFPNCLKLYIDGVLIQFISVNSSGLYTFTGVSFTGSQLILIDLQPGNC